MIITIFTQRKQLFSIGIIHNSFRLIINGIVQLITTFDEIHEWIHQVNIKNAFNMEIATTKLITFDVVEVNWKILQKITTI